MVGMCRYDSSRQEIESQEMHRNATDIMRCYDKIDEWKTLSELHPSAVSVGSAADITPWLNSVEIENFFFDEEELNIVLQVIESFATLTQTLRKKPELFPLLAEILGNPEGIHLVRDKIRSAVDVKNQLLPYASVAWGKLGTEIERLEKEARRVVHSLYKTWQQAGYTAETDITIREERLLIPVLAEHKRRINGFVKDISATGKIIYIEPIESLELNNRLTELYAEKRRERERILREITSFLRPHKQALAQTMTALAALDVIRVFYEMGRRLNSHRPKISERQMIHLKDAVNPLLWLKNKNSGKPVIPMSLHLNAEDRVMIISGPNAGGKSISLKTAVLLQYMAQFGLFIPAKSESELGVFSNILIDCGDGQSLDDGLSTFSAHLQHLSKMIRTSSKSTFFAIDELGDGTDPRFGGPIAQAILEELLRSKALGIVTTHYSRLKEWAGQTEGVLNASMAYDTRELQPLYQLVSGKPGSSFALELMRKTGFVQPIIDRVKDLSGEDSGRMEDLLMELSAKQLDLDQTLIENTKKQEQLELLLKEYSDLKEKLNAKKKDILESSRKQASDLLKEANKQIELTIRTIREHGAQPEKTKKARENLEQFRQKKVAEVDKNVAAKLPQNKPAVPSKRIQYQPGMWVRNSLNSAKGEVLEVKKDKLLAVFGLLKMWVPFSEIEPIEIEKSNKHRNKVSGYDWVGRQSEFKNSLDLRGIMADEAQKKVQVWLDEAYALGQNHLKIIHGRGDGILRKTLRAFFKTLPYVKSWKSEREEQGGDGCTLVELF